MFSENYNPLKQLDTEYLFKLEVLDICTNGAYMGMWQLLAAANILQHPIRSVYPDVERSRNLDRSFRNIYIIPSFPTREQHAHSVQNARLRFNKLNQ